MAELKRNTIIVKGKLVVRLHGFTAVAELKRRGLPREARFV